MSKSLERDVLEISQRILKAFRDGCLTKMRERKKQGTLAEGHYQGLDDGEKLVKNKEDLTFVIQMALLGLHHTYDNHTGSSATTKVSDTNYEIGYKLGLDDAIEVITGYKFQ